MGFVVSFAPVDSALGGVVGVLATAYPLPGLVRAAVDEASRGAVTSEVREALSWLAALVLALVAFGASAWAVLRLMSIRTQRPATHARIQARSDVVSAYTAQALAARQVRAAALAAKDASSTALTALPVEAGATYVHVGPRTAWVCPRRHPDGITVEAIDTAIHRSVTVDAHIVYVVRDDPRSTLAWPTALAVMVRHHQHTCRIPPRPRPPLD